MREVEPHTQKLTTSGLTWPSPNKLTPSRFMASLCLCQSQSQSQEQDTWLTIFCVFFSFHFGFKCFMCGKANAHCATPSYLGCASEISWRMQSQVSWLKGQQTVESAKGSAAKFMKNHNFQWHEERMRQTGMPDCVMGTNYRVKL